MLTFFVRRLLAAVPAICTLVVATFLIMRVLPGDPAAFFASGPVPTAEETAYVRQKLGLDRTVPEQLLIYVKDIARADLGMSFTTGRPVLTELRERLPASLELAVTALLLALAISIPLGVMAAIWRGSPVDHLARVISSIGVSMPTFVTGLLLTYVFFLWLGLAPEPVDRIDMFIAAPPRLTGFLLIDSSLSGRWDALQSAAGRLVLPSITMAIFVLSPLTRMTRSSMLGVLSSDFVRTARAMGLSDVTVYIRYALRNALLPVLTTMGIVFSTMLGSNVLVERVFGWPGIGSFALNALLASDYAPVQGFVLLMGLLLVTVNLAIDVAYGLADPRARRGV
ncbi:MULTISPECIES: ABC transporter permease [Bradyrhizobium]|uniref:ABC transporter permease n=1 Tax=Bradyrhizobium aeschynomenes TaxID=2734909 RepID=A0ABX2CGA8_9BRAD|nr:MULTISPECIES: ABC transporter permease [Bradyrhizobium]NPU13419.1 ABC transporter permease [Bradyrhizobium aeschynomenes]NPU66339.1 ABC transporter permease [Bradyrhizobium aeschynomenes]NPV20051.1 ABC transporter permease [Bradyrhizobium aeschynomenes]